MPKRQNTAPDDGRAGARASEQTDTPPRRGRGATTSHETLAREIDEARQLLDKGLSGAAQARLASVIEAAGGAPAHVAEARCILSEALEWQGRFNESLEAVEMYEAPEARALLEKETSLQLRVRLGLACNYTGDFPKAIALLSATLRDATEDGSVMIRGAALVALARVYRSINEYTISRDFLQKALECYRHVGDWRGLGEVYMGFGVVDAYEGEYESALANYEQAHKLLSERAAPQILGRLYANMGGVCWFIKRPHDGIRYLEKAVHYYDHTEHKLNAATGYNNLGINLTLVGQWERAHEALKRALELAFEVDRHNAHVPIILVSLGNLRLVMGEFEEAQTLLERAVRLAIEDGNKWYTGQSKRSLGRCLLAMGEVERARAEGVEALALAERIGDRHAICESRLLLAEAHLRLGDADECAAQLQIVTEKTTASLADLAIAGAAERIHGLLWMARKDADRAIHHFGRGVSIFEMLGDRYSSAVAHYELGNAFISTQPARATGSLALSARVFRELGARRDLARADAALDALGHVEEHPAPIPREAGDTPALSPLLTLRLAEASSLRELLLRELVAVVSQETGAQKVLVAEPEQDGKFKLVAAHGYHTEGEKQRIIEALNQAQGERAAEQLALSGNAALLRLEASNAPPALLVVVPRAAAMPPGSVIIDPLARVATMGLELCAFREHARTARVGHRQSTQAAGSILPGFIHSSPAMQSLVNEIYKIRSSDVTVLVTGESGTGKELVARAIHALSNRRDQSFIAFNCTAVPKELFESFLFGYRKGAFTGAVADSPGVIRAATGGTLFLDEIGDLPLDVQPKLLRFLQEGEIQPLGEQRPVKVAVRVIAATNCDLKKMVEERRFREDLYYRLNVIRLNVPPLRERRSEIQPLVQHYIEHYSEKFKRRDIQITPQAVDLLMVSDWPGNVRQLCNELQRIVARAEEGTVITPQHLSRDILLSSATQTGQLLASSRSDATRYAETPRPDASISDAVEHLERRMIADALRIQHGNVTRAARQLGLTRRGLQLKLARYEIDTTTTTDDDA